MHSHPCHNGFSNLREAQRPINHISCILEFGMKRGAVKQVIFCWHVIRGGGWSMGTEGSAFKFNLNNSDSTISVLLTGFAPLRGIHRELTI